MNRPAERKVYRQQKESAGFFVWLGNNIIPIGVSFVLIVVGITAYLALNMKKPEVTIETGDKPQFTLKDIRNGRKDAQKARYANADCSRDIHCRQLKRIYEDGGTSPEAIRRNLLAADRSISFEQLQQNVNRYAGTPWAFEGKIHSFVWQDNSLGDYTRAIVVVEDGPGKQVYVRGDFETVVSKGDYVYVVGYIAGANYPQPGVSSVKNETIIPSVTARALLKPSEAREILYGSGTN